MTRINLLPGRERERDGRTRRAVPLLAAALLFSLVLLVHGFFCLRLEHLEGAVKEAGNRLALLSEITENLDRCERDAETLGKKIGAVERMERGRARSARLLAMVPEKIPPGRMWLTVLSGSSRGVRLEGRALDNAAVACFMREIEAAGPFRSVGLVSAKQTLFEGEKVVEFVLSCPFEDP